MPKKTSSSVNTLRSVNPTNPNFNLGFGTNVAVFIIMLLMSMIDFSLLMNYQIIHQNIILVEM